MSIEKALYQAPQGLQALEDVDNEGPELEIEIEDPESVTIGVDGVPLLTIEPGEDDEDFNENLAEIINEGELQGLASDLAFDIDNDLASRKDWETMYKDGITLLGLKFEERTEP